MLTTKKTSKSPLPPTLLVVCERIPSVITDGFSTQRAINALSVSMIWRHVNHTIVRSCSRVSYIGQDSKIYIIESRRRHSLRMQIVLYPVKSRFVRRINCYSTPKWSIMWYNSSCSPLASSWTSVELLHYVHNYYIIVRIQCGLLPNSRIYIRHHK